MDMDPKYKIVMYATLIMITILLCMEMAWGCVDCDLNKKAFDKNVNAVKIIKGDNSLEYIDGDISTTKYADGDKVVDIIEKIERIENDKAVYYDKVTTIQPKKVDGQYCFIKVIIKQQGNNIIKEEILECADGRKKFDGPSYWELFAQFYYRDINTPEYCRYYRRSKHAFKSFGRVCMNKDGEWEVR